MNLIEQEVSQERFIDIYYKHKDMSPPGSHKPNTAVPQAYYNQVVGTKKICTETGTGQWGERFGPCLFPLRLGVRSLYGKDQLQPETISTAHGGDRGKPLYCQSQR